MYRGADWVLAEFYIKRMWTGFNSSIITVKIP
jgi:hypothetical protein